MSALKPPESGSWTESQDMTSHTKGGGAWREEEEGGGAWREENTLPVLAAQVFSPAPFSPVSPADDIRESWEAEKRPFLQQHFLEEEWEEEAPPTASCCRERLLLKMLVSMVTSALIFPFLLWGGFVFLPFDAPLMDSAPLRLVYALRCSVFATLPVALGYLVVGVSRLRSGDVVAPCETGGQKGAWPEPRGARSGDVGVHRAFVNDSAHLFLLYFLQLVVMATYLSQEQLKLVPLLTVLFCVGRLVYWVAAAFHSSVRAFGFGLSFLPALLMTGANLYFLVTMEMSAFDPPLAEQASPPGRQRFWG